jgi:hypothetical protein
MRMFWYRIGAASSMQRKLGSASAATLLQLTPRPRHQPIME